MRASSEKLGVLTLAFFGLCLSLSAMQQNGPRDSVGENSKIGEDQKRPPAQPPIQQPSKQDSLRNAPSSDVISSAKEIPKSSEAKGSFSELTLFLFASGLALFVALLGWSDQIRGINKDTREMENCFLEDTGMKKRDFLRIIKPESADKQLEALTEMANAGKFKTKDSVQLLQKFTKWQREWSAGWPYLERLSTWKYNLTIILTIALFVAGTVSLFTTPSESVQLCSVQVRIEMLVLMLPMTIVTVLLGIIIGIAKREKALRTLLNSMADLT